MLTKEQAALLLDKYTSDSYAIETHRKFRQELTRKYDEVLKHFPNKTSDSIYRGYTFRSTNYIKFYKKLLDILSSGYIFIEPVSSWSNKLSVALNFFNGVYSQYSDYSILLKTSVKPAACIDVSNSGVMDENELILPPKSRIKVELIALYAQDECMYWCNSNFTSWVRTYLYNDTRMPYIEDFIEGLDCLSKSQKEKLCSYL